MSECIPSSATELAAMLCRSQECWIASISVPGAIESKEINRCPVPTGGKPVRVRTELWAEHPLVHVEVCCAGLKLSTTLKSHGMNYFSRSPRSCGESRVRAFSGTENGYWLYMTNAWYSSKLRPRVGLLTATYARSKLAEHKQVSRTRSRMYISWRTCEWCL